MALFFNGQCRVAYSEYFSSQTACKAKIKLNGSGWFPQVT